MNIYFYNAWHNGDLHVSRTFVRYIMENIKAKNYYYCHSNSKKILSDIENLKQIPFDCINKNDERGYFMQSDQDYYINTWYGSYDFSYLNNQELNLYTLFNIFKRTLKELFNHKILNDPIFFLPKVDFTKFDVRDIDNFILKDNRKKVLICNNEVDSGQSENFDFNPIIKRLSDEYPNILFIITNVIDNNLIEKDNIVYCRNIINSNDNDLNEIGYLSKFCDIVVGRYSGPYTFATTYETLLDPNKIFINFVNKKTRTYNYGDGSFGISAFLPEGKRTKFVTSSNFSESNIINVIKGELI